MDPYPSGRILRPAARWAALSLVVGAALVVLLSRHVGWDAVRTVLAGMDGRLLPVVVAVQVASLAALTQTYRTTFAIQGGRLSFRDGLTVCLGAFSLTQLLPAGGAAGGAFVVHRLRRHGADPVRAVATVALLGIVTMGTLALALSVATTVSALRTDRYVVHAVISTTVAIAILAALAVLRRLVDSERVRHGFAARLQRLQWRGHRVATDWVDGLHRHQRLLRDPRALLRPVAWSALNWSLDLLVLVLVLAAVGAGAPLVGVLIGFAVANLLNGLPTTPGGIGVVEAGLAGTLVAFGADPVAASVGVLAYRVLALWLPVLLGAPVVATGLSRAAAPRVVAA